jgi:benzoyl-CoA reductase subunit D
VTYITATGVGRESIDFAQKYTPDVVAIAKGAFYHFPSMRTVFDIGAEQGRAVKCDASGKVLKFARNEKCAAGAGEFLEYIAKAVEVDIAEMGELSLLSTVDVSVSGNCAVFAESEVVSLIHSNVAKADIIRALLDSLAMRTASLGQRVDCEEEMVVAGGLAQMKGFIKCLETHLNTRLLVPENPQFVTALGAALLSIDSKEAN